MQDKDLSHMQEKDLSHMQDKDVSSGRSPKKHGGSGFVEDLPVGHNY